MSAKSTSSLDELRSQARRTFRTWPIYLMLRLRDVEQHLTSAQRAELGPVLGFDTPDSQGTMLASTIPDERLALLIEYGLLPRDVVIPNAMPALIAHPPLTTCHFYTQTQNDSAVLICEIQHEGVAQQVELMRTEPIYADDLALAADLFGQIHSDVSPIAALESAQRWAVLHGSRQLPWTILEVQASNTKMPTLPPRRRGRGQFRSPG